MNLDEKCSLFCYAASLSFDPLGVGRSIRSVVDLAREKKIPDIEMAQKALEKFNQLVVPYLGMKSVKSSFNNPIYRGIQDPLEFFMHDLVHEAIDEGALKRFRKIKKNYNKTIKEWKEENTKAETYPIRLEHEPFSLEDFVKEDIAEYLTDSTLIKTWQPNGIIKYFNTVFIGVANRDYDFDISDNEMDFGGYYVEDVKEFIDILESQINKDIETMQNIKMKEFVSKLFRFVFHQAQKLPLVNDNSGEIYLTKIYQPLNRNIVSFLESSFGVRNQNKKDKEPQKDNPDGWVEKGKWNYELGAKPQPRADLADPFMASLIRRWILSLEQYINAKNAGIQNVYP